TFQTSLIADFVDAFSPAGLLFIHIIIHATLILTSGNTTTEATEIFYSCMIKPQCFPPGLSK
ncbi:hypothetical protein BgiBS90_012899, partial [Biomphalaria glabrata]